MTGSVVDISEVEAGDDLPILRSLLEEFHGWMRETAGEEYDPEGELLEDFQSLASESDSRAWVARVDGDPAGCVLFYGLTETMAEFKRLWVTPAHRREGVGRALTVHVIEHARAAGYETLGLTTTPWAEAAQAMYEDLGFEHTDPYPETRLDEQYHDPAVFMQRDLSDNGEEVSAR